MVLKPFFFFLQTFGIFPSSLLLVLINSNSTDSWHKHVDDTFDRNNAGWLQLSLHPYPVLASSAPERTLTDTHITPEAPESKN